MIIKKIFSQLHNILIYVKDIMFERLHKCNVVKRTIISKHQNMGYEY